MELSLFIEFLKRKKYELNVIDNKCQLNINSNKIIFDIEKKKYCIEGLIPGHERILDLTKQENYSVVMLLIKLFEKGYSKNVITLEKRWQLGHDDSGSLDVMLKNPQDNSIYMFEVKTSEEIKKYTNINNEKKLKQVFSYAIQEKSTKIISFYAYDFVNNNDCFFNVFTSEILKNSENVDDFFERWNKVFDKSDYIINNPVFNAKQGVKKYENLEIITSNDTKLLFNQFLTILRLHSISDKPNAFMKMINLFLAKIGDEITNNKVFKIKDSNGNLYEFNGVKFQYVNGIDTPESFMKRLNELYKSGMHEYLNKEVIDYNDDEIEAFIKEKESKELFTIFDNLRLKKNNNFSFIEVYDDDTFYQNFEVVKSMVELLENFRFKYETKYQFLGDFFEELLNTSLKQEAGQFFTPYPIVDFMVNSLPYEELILEKINKHDIDFLPKVIDYACGAGHFLISSMARTQNILKELGNSTSLVLTPMQERKMTNYLSDPYSWVNKNNIVGIEKDYRLAKTTKIATFLNGDGDAEIISGDGINKFSSKDYENTILYSANKKKIEKFDFLIANPPYSIDGFMRNFTKNNISKSSGDFTLLNKINYNDSAIEKFFVERAEQLVCKNGYVAIVLPQSILSNEKYEDLREFIFKKFKILGLLLTSDITFSGTTTSPVILFMKKQDINDLDYKTMIICSPKYLSPNGEKLKSKEIEFLGYEFSSNRAKSGITIKEKSSLNDLVNYMHAFIIDKDFDIEDKYSKNVFIRNFKDIILNKNETYCGDIYPKYMSKNGKPLSEFCKLNARKESDFDVLPQKYVEISDLSISGLGNGTKKEKTTRFCKKGDILLSSLCPRADKIMVSNDNYMCSTAIHVLSGFKDDNERDKVLIALKKKETIEQMNSLLDGFKITYAKINDENLYNNVKIDI